MTRSTTRGACSKSPPARSDLQQLAWRAAGAPSTPEHLRRVVGLARPDGALLRNEPSDLTPRIDRYCLGMGSGHGATATAWGVERVAPGTSTPSAMRRRSAEQIAILLEAAAELDRREAVIDVMDRHGRTWTQRQPILTTGRRAAMATLQLGSGRASATRAMLRRDVDLANGRFEVGRDKTDAGMRQVDMLPLLREILTEHNAASERTGPNDPVFVTCRGAWNTAPPARDHVAQAAPHVRVDPGSDR